MKWQYIEVHRNHEMAVQWGSSKPWNGNTLSFMVIRKWQYIGIWNVNWILLLQLLLGSQLLSRIQHSSLGSANHDAWSLSRDLLILFTSCILYCLMEEQGERLKLLRTLLILWQSLLAAVVVSFLCFPPITCCHYVCCFLSFLFFFFFFLTHDSFQWLAAIFFVCPQRDLWWWPCGGTWISTLLINLWSEFV